MKIQNKKQRIKDSTIFDNLYNLISFKIFRNLYIHSLKNKALIFLFFIFEMTQIIILSECLFFSTNPTRNNFNSTIYKRINSLYEILNLILVTNSLGCDFSAQSLISNYNCDTNYTLKNIISYILIIIGLGFILILHWDPKFFKKSSNFIKFLFDLFRKFLSVIIFLIFKTFLFYLLIIIIQPTIEVLIIKGLSNLNLKDFLFMISSIFFTSLLMFVSLKFQIFYLKCYENKIFSIKFSNYKEILEIILKLPVALLFHLVHIKDENSIYLVKEEILTFVKIFCLIFYLIYFTFCARNYLQEISRNIFSNLKFFIEILFMNFVMIQIILYLIINISNSLYKFSESNDEILLTSFVFVITIASSLFVYLIFKEIISRNLNKEEIFNLSKISEYSLKKLIHLTSIIFEVKFYKLLTNYKKKVKFLGNFKILDNKANNSIKEKYFIQTISYWLNSHICSCDSISLNCEICEFRENFLEIKSKLGESDTEETNILNTTQCIKEILEFLSKFLESLKFLQISKFPKNFKNFKNLQILLKSILIFLQNDLDHSERILYYLNSLRQRFNNSSNSNIEMNYLLTLLKKTLIENERKNDKNLEGILNIKYWKLNQNFLEISNLFKFLITQMIGAYDSIKVDLLERKNLEFGKNFKKVRNKITDLKQYKNEDFGNYLLYLTAFKEITNEEIDSDISLSQIEINDILNEKFYNNKFFFLEKIDNIIYIKSYPEIFSRFFQFEKTETNLENLFPYLIRNYQQNLLLKNISECEKKYSTNLYLIMRDGYIINLNFIFEKLPVISEKILLIAYVKLEKIKKEKQEEDKINTNEEYPVDNSYNSLFKNFILNSSSQNGKNLILINQFGEAFYLSKFFTKFFGFFPNFNSIRLGKINLPFLFSFDFNKFFQNFLNDLGKNPINEFELELDFEKFSKNYLQVFELEMNKFAIQEISRNLFNLIGENLNILKINFSILDVIKLENSQDNSNSSDNMIDMEYHEYQKIYFIISVKILNLDENKIKNTTFRNLSTFGNNLNAEMNEKFLENKKNKNSLRTQDYNLKFRSYNEASVSSSSSVSDTNSFYKNLDREKFLKNQKTKKYSKIILAIFLCEVFSIVIGLGCLLFINILSERIKNTITASIDLIVLHSNFLNLVSHDENSVMIDENISNPLQDIYKQDFKKMSELYSNNLKQSAKEVKAYLNENLIDEFFNKEFSFLLTNRSNDPKPFFDILNFLSNQHFVLSNRNEYYIQMSIKNQKDFIIMNDIEKILLTIIMNYKNVNSIFINFNQTLFEYLNHSLENFYFEIFLIFLIFCSINLISGILYIIDVKILNQKIQLTTNKLISLDERNLKNVLRLFEDIENLINLKLKPGKILKKVKKLYNPQTDLQHFSSKAKQISPINKNSTTNHPINKKYELKIFSRAVNLIFLVYSIVILFFIISYILINDIKKEIKLIKSLNSNLIHLQTESVDYFLQMKFSILTNDQSQEEFLEKTPIKIYSYLQGIIDIVENEKNLVEMKNFIEYFRKNQICEKIFIDDENVQNLTNICKTIEILSSDYEELFAFIIKFSREMYLKFLNENKGDYDVAKISEIYHDKRFQDLNFILIFVLRNLNQNMLSKIGLNFYYETLSRLVIFSIIIFSITIIFKILISGLIRFGILRKLMITQENFNIIEKSFKI